MKFGAFDTDILRQINEDAFEFDVTLLVSGWWISGFITPARFSRIGSTKSRDGPEEPAEGSGSPVRRFHRRRPNSWKPHGATGRIDRLQESRVLTLGLPYCISATQNAGTPVMTRPLTIRSCALTQPALRRGHRA
jgi:hypothetical protein